MNNQSQYQEIWKKCITYVIGFSKERKKTCKKSNKMSTDQGENTNCFLKVQLNMRNDERFIIIKDLKSWEIKKNRTTK